MVNRPAGGARSKKYLRADYDWYCENEIPVRQLLDCIDFADDLIWDPCCGRGNILDVARERGHRTVGSDIVDRSPRHRFIRGNVLTQISRPPGSHARPTSVISNPPYGYEEDIAERIMRRVLAWPVRQSAFLLPIAFLASAGRWRFFEQDWRAAHVLICSERPTMPPGHRIGELGPQAFRGGMADYIWLVYRYPHRWRTETRWLRPDELPPRKIFAD